MRRSFRCAQLDRYEHLVEEASTYSTEGSHNKSDQGGRSAVRVAERHNGERSANAQGFERSLDNG